MQITHRITSGLELSVWQNNVEKKQRMRKEMRLRLDFPYLTEG